jgi:D-alanyl-lipoteichoic acid acyltransferase DltB (MBOAT superfamily)
VVNFYLGQIIGRRKELLALTIVFNLFILGYYKYLGFFTDTANSVLALFGAGPFSVAAVLLPLGVSFFTFHAMSYVIDVYRGDRQPEPSLLRFMLYETFWPHLIAGPILRSHEIIPQFETPRVFQYKDMSYGVRRILDGLFKKVVLADSLAAFIDEGFKDPEYMNNSAIDTWALAIGFGLQIYFDFSGYSDIAIGSARLFGYRFPENFNYPYVSSSPKEFWSRWHITLSSWIRDYLYIPMQQLRRQRSTAEGGIGIDAPIAVAQTRRNVALFGTWALMGLWHGANWTFVIWGVWHAIAIQAFRIWTSVTATEENRIGTGVSGQVLGLVGFILTTMWVMTGWIWFRSNDIHQATIMLSSLVNPALYLTHNLHPNFHVLTFFCLVGMYVSYITQRALAQWGDKYTCTRDIGILVSVKYCAMLTLVIAFIKQGTTFIYFQF